MRRIITLIAVCMLVALGAGGSAAAGSAAGPPDAALEPAERWVWPVGQDVAVTGPYAAPPHRYGSGHRGVDLLADAGALRAPASGVIAFAGVVVDRPLLTIDHGDGLVTTLEPATTDLSVGDAVSRGEEIAALASGGHTPPGSVHFGVRLHGEYVNPLLLLDGVPRAVLLPCCG